MCFAVSSASFTRCCHMCEKKIVKNYVNFLISFGEEKVKICQCTCKEFQLFLERILYYNFYKNQECYRAAINRHLCALCFLMVKGAVSNLDIRLRLILKVILIFLKSHKAYCAYFTSTSSVPCTCSHCFECRPPAIVEKGIYSDE